MPSDGLLQAARLSGIAILFLIVLLIGCIILLRVWLNTRARREERLATRWLPIFTQAIEEGRHPPLPRLGPSELALVLGLWLRFYQSLRGQARSRLRDLAGEIHLAAFARRLLTSRNTQERIMAILALGHLGEETAWQDLERLGQDDNPMLSLLAAGAMLQINAVWSIEDVLARITQRSDWPMTTVSLLLAEADPAAVVPALRNAVRLSPPKRLPRLLPLLKVVNVTGSADLLLPLLAADQPLEVLVAALKVAEDPLLLPTVRRLVDHPEWPVRAQAARALGRLGETADVTTLRALLSDRVWWVRYRAARSLLKLPGIGPAQLSEFAATSSDRFARDILGQILAEAEAAR